MNINNFRITRDIYKHIYSFMPGFATSKHLNLIKATGADDFDLWVKHYEAIVKIKRKNQRIIDRTMTLRFSVSSQLERKLYSDRTGDYMELHWACQDGKTEVALALLEKGADVNITRSDGRTPLHYACDKGNEVVVKALLEKGADVDLHAKNSSGYSPGWAPLHFACVFGHAEVVKALLEKDADVHAVCSNGKTPLHNACRNGNAEVVKALLKKGADVHANSNSGWTPLHDACWRGRRSVIKTMIDNGADVNAKNNDGRTPLHYWVCEKGLTKVVNALLDMCADADLHAKDNDGWTFYQQFLARFNELSRT